MVRKKTVIYSQCQRETRGLRMNWESRKGHFYLHSCGVMISNASGAQVEYAFAIYLGTNKGVESDSDFALPQLEFY